MSTDALGPQFAEHIAAFRDRFNERGFHDPDVCVGECATATGLFARHLSNRGVAEHHAREFDTPDHDNDEDGHVFNHIVNVVPHPQTGEPHVVDWTARQFDHRAAYPVVAPLGDYQKRMEMHDTPHNWEGYRDTDHIAQNASQYEHLHGPERDDWTRDAYRRRNLGSKF